MRVNADVHGGRCARDEDVDECTTTHQCNIHLKKKKAEEGVFLVAPVEISTLRGFVFARFGSFVVFDFVTLCRSRGCSSEVREESLDR